MGMCFAVVMNCVFFPVLELAVTVFAVSIDVCQTLYCCVCIVSRASDQIRGLMYLIIDSWLGSEGN